MMRSTDLPCRFNEKYVGSRGRGILAQGSDGCG